ncbi:MAG: hypothetical protein WC635_06050 [Bacteriovorax sp.]|jgi:hypothetical protein
MISTAKALVAFSLLIIMNLGFAETEKNISYENQREESFDLENFLKETRYKQEQVESTCYRQVPYTENVCRNETRYRQECRTIPGHQECSTVYDRVCHTETRYERECRTYPGEQMCRVVVRYRQECERRGGGRQCRQIPPDIRCHRAPNGEQRCEKIPGREECTNTPGEQVCRQVPYEERECHTGPSRQECRDVPRQHQVCENRPRQQCDWIPDQRVCENIPYYERVCKDEILYRQEAYACMKTIDVPYEVTLKTHKANVLLEFINSAALVTPAFNVSLSTGGVMSLKAKDQGASKTAAFVKKDVKNAEQENTNTISAKYKIALFDRSELFKFVDSGLSNLELKKDSLSFYVLGKFEVKRATLAIRIAKKDEVKFEKTLNGTQILAEFDGIGTKVTVDIEKYGAPKLGGVFTKKHNVTLKLKLDYSDVGEILLPEKGELSATLQQDVSVE